MGKIKILSTETIKKISAGEVIERPVSVVKELVENSIDAQADKIYVEVKNGGKKLIRVKDNGIGMNKEDIFLSVDRYATSKISSIDDIYKIRSLGFRGEALSSISAVSKLEIISKDENSEVAYKLTVINGEKKIEECTSSRGTVVSVMDLFYNVPVRLKFLKSIETETSHIYNLIFKFAISNVNISFRLEIDGNVSLNVLAVKSLKERLYELLGKEFIDNLLEVKFKNEEIEVFGYIGKPDFSKTTKNYQYIFVNNRIITDKVISHAVLSGYENLIPHNRYPVCILFINIDPSKIDINIHPTKREIKFINTNLVHSSMVNAIKETLRKEKPLPKVFPEKVTTTNNTTSYYKILETRTNTISELIKDFDAELIAKPIQQLKLMYILAESDDGIYIIDQHVAHEKVLYEKLSKSSLSQNVTQYYLTPISLELNFSQSNILNKYLKDLLNLGFDIENFGKNTFLIRGIPMFLKESNAEKILIKVIDEVSEDFANSNLVKEDKNVFIRAVACHSAVRAGDKLTYDEMVKLVNEFLKCDIQYCPHGRPGLIKISFDEIGKKFGRI